MHFRRREFICTPWAAASFANAPTCVQWQLSTGFMNSWHFLWFSIKFNSKQPVSLPFTSSHISLTSKQLIFEPWILALCKTPLAKDNPLNYCDIQGLDPYFFQCESHPKEISSLLNFSLLGDSFPTTPKIFFSLFPPSQFSITPISY